MYNGCSARSDNRYCHRIGLKKVFNSLYNVKVDHSFSVYILITDMFKLPFNEYFLLLNLLYQKHAHADGVDTRPQFNRYVSQLNTPLT